MMRNMIKSSLTEFWVATPSQSQSNLKGKEEPSRDKERSQELEDSFEGEEGGNCFSSQGSRIRPREFRIRSAFAYGGEAT